MKNTRLAVELALLLVVSSALGLAWQEAPVQRGTFVFKSESPTLAVSIDSADGTPGIAWPQPADGVRWDTALLQLSVTVDPDAQDPFVEISAGGVTDRQYFGPGDSGVRDRKSVV